MLALVVAWNALDLAGRDAAPRAYAALRPAANATMLRQSWKLFYEPTRYDSWFVYAGRLASGERVDLLRGTPLGNDERPAAGQQFANHRWRKLHARLVSDHWASYRQPLAEHLVRAWNATHGDEQRAVRLDAYVVRRPVTRAGAPDGFVRVQLARVIVDPQEGNFAEALRELGP